MKKVLNVILRYSEGSRRPYAAAGSFGVPQDDDNVRRNCIANRSAMMMFALIAIFLTGCKLKPSHNMEDQPSAKTYQPSSVFADGSSARPIPYGTVPRTAAESPGFPYADVRETLPAMMDSAAESDVIPFPITRDVLTRGQQRYDIYCSVCHGRLGDGAGMVVQRGLTPPPSFHIARLRGVSDGHIYNVISNGYGQMFSYNDRVLPEDRWMIAAYIRALQAGTDPANSLAKLTPDDRRKLEGTRP